MFGNNPIRPPEKNEGKSLYIQEIFRTFQGEGPYSGWPAVFIRLGGCNLACNFCDTEFESFTEKDIDAIIAEVNTLSGKDNNNFTHNLIVITGGEPFRQNISLLCNNLIALGYIIQIETNGTLYRPIDERVSIVCSPKNTGSGYHHIRDDLLRRINAFKFIISAHNKLYNNVAEVGQKEYNIPVYIQPMDEYDEKKNLENIKVVKDMADKYGYRVSMQIHKIVGVR